MSLELPVEPLSAVRILDPRITINDQANKTYGVFTGPAQNTFRTVVSTNFSGSSILIDMPVPSMQTYINRKIYVNPVFTLTFTGTSVGGNVLLQGPDLPTSTGLVTPGNVAYYNAPRAYPFAQICSAFQLTLGNAVISSNLNTYHRALMRYMNPVEDRDLDLSMTPGMLDQHFEYFVAAGLQNRIQFSNRNPLGTYTANVQEEPRGSFIGCTVMSNTATSAVVELEVIEPFWISPCLWERGDEQVAFIGLNNMQMQFTLAGRGGGNIANGLWSTAVDPSISTITGVSVVVNSCQAYVNYMTPQLTQSIPRTVFYGYYDLTNYQTASQQVLAAGGTELYVMNAIQLNSIPGRVYIFVSDRDSNANYTIPDYFLSIQSINITWENQDGLLNSASVADLYQMSLRAGCNMSFRQWTYDIGSVLCIQWASDLNLNNLDAPGKRGQYNFSFRISVFNQTNGPVYPTINCLVVQEGVLSIEQNSVIRSLGVLDSRTVLDTIETGTIAPYQKPKTVYGGFSWNSIKNFFRSTLPKALRSGVNVASKLAPAQYQPYLALADEGLKLTGHGKRRRMVRHRGGHMMSRGELERSLR